MCSTSAACVPSSLSYLLVLCSLVLVSPLGSFDFFWFCSALVCSGKKKWVPWFVFPFQMKRKNGTKNFLKLGMSCFSSLLLLLKRSFWRNLMWDPFLFSCHLFICLDPKVHKDQGVSIFCTYSCSLLQCCCL